MNFIIAALMLIALPACRVPKSAYGPTTSNVGSAPSGHPSAVYEIPLGEKKGGQVQVWTEGIVDDAVAGAEPANAQSGPRSFRIVLSVRNDASEPIAINPAEVRLVFDDMPELRPRETAMVFVPPAQSSEVVLRYPLPGRFEQTPPDSYKVAWQLRFGTEEYKQVTPFTREQERGFVPRVMDSSEPGDRRYIEGREAPAAIGIPFGKDPNKR